MDGSAHLSVSFGCQGKCINSRPSVLGLDKMIDEKRDARTMSERVVHIKMCTIKLPVPLASFRFQCIELPAEILGDPYAKKCPLPRIGPITRLPVSPSIPSHQILGQSCLHNRLSLLHTSTRRAPLE